VEVNPDTLATVGDPTELTEFPCPVRAPEVSADGLWMTFGCSRECLTAAGDPYAAGNDDLCIASRSSVDDAGWTHFRVLDEISSTVRHEEEPAWREGPDGRPLEIFWVTHTTNPLLGFENADLCVAAFDPDADATCLQGPCKGAVTGVARDADGQPTCIPFQGPGSAVVVTDPYFAERSPQWSKPGGRFFVWSRNGADFDVFLARAEDGVVTEHLGALSASTGVNDLGVALAPLVAPHAGIVAWTTILDLTGYTGGSDLNLARLPVLTE
jgi:hypothetical protein